MGYEWGFSLRSFFIIGLSGLSRFFFSLRSKSSFVRGFLGLNGLLICTLLTTIRVIRGCFFSLRSKFFIIPDTVVPPYRACGFNGLSGFFLFAGENLSV